MPRRNTGGIVVRPTKVNKREKRYVVRFTQDEAAKIEEVARTEGTSVANYMRSSALGRKSHGGRLDKDIQREIWKQVAGMGRNINQITRLSNAGYLRLTERDILELTDSIQTLTSKISEMAGPKKGHGGQGDT